MKMRTRLLQYVLCIVCLLSPLPIQPMVQFKAWVPRSIQELTFTQKAIGAALMTMALMYAAVRVWYAPTPSTARDQTSRTTQTPVLSTADNMNVSSKKAPLVPSTVVPRPQLSPQGIRPDTKPAGQMAPIQSPVMSDDAIKQRTAEMIGDALFNYLLRGSTSNTIPGFEQPSFMSIKRLFTIIKLKRKDLIKEILIEVQKLHPDFSWPRGLSILLGMTNPSFIQITIPEDIAKLKESKTKDKNLAPEYLSYWLDLDISPLYKISSVIQQSSPSKFFNVVKNKDYKEDRFRLSEVFHLYREAKQLSQQVPANSQIHQDLENYGNQLKRFLLKTPENYRVPIYVPNIEELHQKQADLEVLKKAVASHAQN